jgi:hypothetical protein
VVAGEALVNPSTAEVIDRIDQHDAA